jgi:hypothetical protein
MEICEVLGKYHCPKHSVIVQRYIFYTRVRKRGVSVTSYVAELCKLSGCCEYGANLDEMIRDHTVRGINRDKDAKPYACSKRGQIASVCRSKTFPQQQRSSHHQTQQRSIHPNQRIDCCV